MKRKKWIEDCVDRETTLAGYPISDAERAIKQEQEDLRNAEKAGLRTRKLKKSFEEMLNAVRDSLCNLSSSEDEEDA